ncbi:MAG: hypothetical protein KBC57_03725 [Neisseriaceae bacterium]|nr:hypothetical protein [Neisseriaceae bacterium]
MNLMLWMAAAVAACASPLALASEAPATGYLRKIEDAATATCHYQNQAGRIIIAARPCEQTIDYGADLQRLPFALALAGGWHAYAPNGAHLFEVFMYDSGPDEPAEGLIRIERDGLIGYAAVDSGKIVVPPRYQCAWPFRDGEAEVGLRCHKVYEPGGEHWRWVADEWLTLRR